MQKFFSLLEQGPSQATAQLTIEASLQSGSELVEPKNRTVQPHLQPLTVYHGRIACQICFVSSDKRHIKRKNFQKFTDISRFKELSETWEKVDHEYNKINQLVNWQDSSDKWAHKACKGKFFKKEFLESQTQLTSTTQVPLEEEQPSNESAAEISDEIESRRQSSRQQHKYDSSWIDENQKCCIICSKDIRVKGRLIPPKTISIVDKAEPTLKEFAEIHIKNNNLKYVEGAKRILLTLSTKSLLAANVAYHQEECYKPFRSPAWKREKKVTDESDSVAEDDSWTSLCQLLRYHVLLKKEVYSLAQVRNMYDELRRELGKDVTKSRSIDIKKRLNKDFGDVLIFLSSEKEINKTEYILSSDSNMSYEVIKSCASGQGIPKYVAIKATAQMLHDSIREIQSTVEWPPAPQDIIEANNDVDTDLFNLISWIIHPKGRIGDNGRVMLPKSKAQKVSQITQNITSLLQCFTIAGSSSSIFNYAQKNWLE